MSEKNKAGFLKNFSIIGAGSFLNLVIGLLTTPVITRIVDPNEYGQLSVFTMYTTIAVMVLCLGLDQALVRYYYEHNDVEYKRSLLFQCVFLPVIITIAVAIIFIGLVGSGIVNFEFDIYVCILLCFNVLFTLVYRFSLLLVRLAYKSKIYANLNVLHKIFYVVVALALLYLFNGHDFVILCIATVFAAFTCMVISIIVQREEWNFKANKNGHRAVEYSELLRYGYPYIFSMGITTLFQAIDKMALNYYCTYSEVGIYSSAMSIIHVFTIIQTTFNALWAPMAVEHYTNNKDDRTFYQKGNLAITVIMFFIGIALILFKDIFALLLGEKYREAAYILPCLIFNPIMYTISETTVSGLVFMKKSKLQVVIAAGACIANIIGNTILVPMYGCQGAAISTGLSYIVFFVLRTFLSNKVFYVDFKLKKFCVLTFAVCIYAIYNTFFEFGWHSIVGAAICFLLLLVLYRDTIKWLLSYVKDMIIELKNKGC